MYAQPRLLLCFSLWPTPVTWLQYVQAYESSSNTSFSEPGVERVQMQVWVSDSCAARRITREIASERDRELHRDESTSILCIDRWRYSGYFCSCCPCWRWCWCWCCFCWDTAEKLEKIYWSCLYCVGGWKSLFNFNIYRGNIQLWYLAFYLYFSLSLVLNWYLFPLIYKFAWMIANFFYWV